MSQNANRRDAILKAARALFATQGFQATTLEDVIAKTGGSRRNIYALFGDKDGLVQAVLMSIAEEVMQSFGELPSDEEDARVWLIAMGETYLGTFTKHDVIGMLRQIIFLASENPQIGIGAYANGPAVLRERIARFFDKKIEQGDLSLDSSEDAARMFMGMVAGDYILKLLMTGGATVTKEEISSHVTSTVDIFLEGASHS
ncbi:TetR/AcrR family transcriptional regulator [Ruegeria hyattellae]|uniref:TetR/AcrR family transcriptional regulator n=1 Tax=Ruegeria hyattellae TaxID=3233337 RepID=UPI00355C0989